MIYSAVLFRNRVFKAACHADALADCIECPDWPESHQVIEQILEDDAEPWAFGYWSETRGFYNFDDSAAKLPGERPGERQKLYKEYML